MSNAVQQVCRSTLLLETERARQQEVCRHSLSKDILQGSAILEASAKCYASALNKNAAMPESWPWCKTKWKPGTHIQNLVKAGALYLAAVDVELNKDSPFGVNQVRVLYFRIQAQEIADRLRILLGSE